jgi:hypothetical protein
MQMMLMSYRWAVCVVLLVLQALASSGADASQATVPYLQGLLPKAADAMTSSGPDLMGDRVNLFNGALEFVHTDVSLKGNSALAVAVTRRHVAGRAIWIRGQFGDWDLELPRISGVFPNTLGWVNGSSDHARCSSYTPPPVQYRSPINTGGGPLKGPAPEITAATPASESAHARALSSPNTGAVPLIGTTVTFHASDYWQGTFLHAGDGSAQEILVRHAADTVVPSDGQAYPLVTKAQWQIRCLGSIHNGPGEGFVALSPDGVQYRFDWMASRFQLAAKREGAALGRAEYMLMVTQMTDRFGNWVRYSYDPAAPMRITRIEANDGRTISFTYNATGRIETPPPPPPLLSVGDEPAPVGAPQRV